MSVQTEVERKINLAIYNNLGITPLKDEAMDAYLDRLVYDGGMNIQELRKATRKCLT